MRYQYFLRFQSFSKSCLPHAVPEFLEEKKVLQLFAGILYTKQYTKTLWRKKNEKHWNAVLITNI